MTPRFCLSLKMAHIFIFFLKIEIDPTENF